MMKQQIKDMRLVILPLIPLIDMMFIKKYAFISTIIYILIILIYSKDVIKRKNIIVLAFFLIQLFTLCISLFSTEIKIEHWMFILTLWTFTVLAFELGNNIEQNISAIIKFVYSYFGLNTAIFLWRFVLYGLDLGRLRGGISIYGGNTAHFIYLEVLYILKTHNSHQKDYFRILTIALINAFLYVSKGAILITAAWIILDIIHQKRTKILSIKRVSAVVVLLTALLNMVPDSFFSYFERRFDQWFSLYKNTGSLMGTRGKILDFTIDFLNKHSYAWYLGIGPMNFRMINPWQYTNTHNLFFDVITDSGLIGLVLFLAIIFQVIIFDKQKSYFILCIIYAVFEGVALFVIKPEDCIMVGFAFMFLIIIYQDCIERKHRKACMR